MENTANLKTMQHEARQNREPLEQTSDSPFLRQKRDAVKAVVEVPSVFSAVTIGLRVPSVLLAVTVGLRVEITLSYWDPQSSNCCVPHQAHPLYRDRRPLVARRRIHLAQFQRCHARIVVEHL